MTTNEWLDLALKILGALAIAIPVWLFFLQDKNEKHRKRSEMQIDLYTNAAVDLYYIFERNVYSEHIEERKEKPLYEYGTKIKLYFRPEISEAYNNLKNNLEFYITILRIYDFGKQYSNLYRKFPSKLYDSPLTFKANSSIFPVIIAEIAEMQQTHLTMANESQIPHNLASLSYKEPVFKTIIDDLIKMLHQLAFDQRDNLNKAKDFIKEIEELAEKPADTINLSHDIYSRKKHFTFFIFNQLNSDERTIKANNLLRQYQHYLLEKIKELDKMVITSNSLFKG